MVANNYDGFTHSVMELFPASKVLEVEILALGRWELATIVDSLAQVLHDAVVAVLT